MGDTASKQLCSPLNFEKYVRIFFDHESVYHVYAI